MFIELLHHLSRKIVLCVACSGAFRQAVCLRKSSANVTRDPCSDTQSMHMVEITVAVSRWSLKSVTTLSRECISMLADCAPAPCPTRAMSISAPLSYIQSIVKRKVRVADRAQEFRPGFACLTCAYPNPLNHYLKHSSTSKVSI